MIAMKFNPKGLAPQAKRNLPSRALRASVLNLLVWTNEKSPHKAGSAVLLYRLRRNNKFPSRSLRASVQMSFGQIMTKMRLIQVVRDKPFALIARD
jgi:hypothetical protein